MENVPTDSPIPDTIVFDGRQAVRGYGLNKMCFSFNEAGNRRRFIEDEAAYCRRFGLSPAQVEAVNKRDINGLIREGGNIYYLAKFAGIFGLTVQEVGALQRGVSLEEFNRMLAAY